MIIGMIQVLDINMCVCVYMSVIDRLLMVHLIVKTFIQTIDIGNDAQYKRCIMVLVFALFFFWSYSNYFHSFNSALNLF